MHLAVALDGSGWHPGAWRDPAARPSELFTARYWTDLVTEAERGLLDLVTIEDSLNCQPAHLLQQSRSGETVQVLRRSRSGEAVLFPGAAGPLGERLTAVLFPGAEGPLGERLTAVPSPGPEVLGREVYRLDALLIAARVAPLTRHIGLVPTVIATHTEPFHISKAVATLDYVSKGRAGVQVQVSASAEDNAHFGRRSLEGVDLLAEAGDYVEVLRRLWDSWEDDAEIRDAATGRFIDRDKVHYIDFEGRYFSVKGPSITPRPPQGQPVVATLAQAGPAYRFAAQSADVTFVTPTDADDAAAIVAQVPGGGHVFGDLAVVLGTSAGEAAARAERLGDFPSDAQVFTGTPVALADLVVDWHRAGLSGVRLRPAGLPADLTAITRGLVPELQRRGVFRTSYEADTLRGLLGLPRPDSRYAEAVSS